jgi:DNA-binding response OmpR family regulator
MEPQKKHSILIIEDDPLLSKMYETKFVTEAFDVYRAGDGEEGLKTALAHHPDIILLDVMMPRVSGIDMLTELRKDSWGAQVPVVILSNLSEQQEGDKAKALGVKEYLVKANFTPAEIVEKIRSYLN